MPLNTLPKALSWPVQATIFLLLLLTVHLSYSWKVDQQWLWLTEFSHPAFQHTPMEQKISWAEEQSQKSFLFLFVKGQLSQIVSCLMDLLAILLLSIGLGFVLQSAVSKRILVSTVFVTYLPTSLYQGFLTATLLVSRDKISQDLAALNPWTLNTFYFHLPLHHPLYGLMNLLSGQLLLGMILALWLLRKMTTLGVVYCSIFAFLPPTLLLACKFLLQ